MRIWKNLPAQHYVPVVLGTLFFLLLNCLSASDASAFSAADGFQPDVNNRIMAIAVQPDGKILIGGVFTTVETVGRNQIARLNSDGSLDTTFDPGTGTDSDVLSIAVQEDGKILIAGYFTSVDGAGRSYIARLESNGTLDAAFAPSVDNYILGMAVQSDGKILVGGAFTDIDGTGLKSIARLNSDGTVDTSFDPGTGADAEVVDIAVQDDGRILIGGGFISVNGIGRNRIARLKTTGSLDTSFDPGAGPDNSVLAIGLQVDGKIVIGGYFQNIDGTSRVRIARLNSNGGLDTGFDPGTGANTDVAELRVQADGKILIGGSFTSVNGTARNYIARLETDGSLDTGFDPVTGANGSVDAVAVQVDGKVLIGGSFTSLNGTVRTRIARFEQDGALEVDFDPGTGPNSVPFAVAVQPDGKVLIGGVFTTVNGTPRSYIARLNTDGSLDTSFNNPNIGLNGYVFAIGVQPDGKIVITGAFTTVNSTSRNRVARLNSDGTLDTDFDPGTGANSEVHALALLPNGKVMLGGWFTTINGISRNRVARLNSDGSLDDTFDPGTGADDNSVFALGVQPDGKVLIGGMFTSVNGTTRNRIARLNSDGSLDTGFFDPGTGPDTLVMALAVQPDNKVLIGGFFTDVSGISRNHIARLNSDGTHDTGFDPGTGTTTDVQTIAIQPDGKVLIGGDFTSVYDGTSRNYIARLNSDGSLDTSFDPGTGANSFVTALAVAPDGKILLGGNFTSMNGTARNYIARVSFPEGASQSLEVLGNGTRVNWLRSGLTTVLNNATLEMSPDGISWSPLGNGERIEGGWQFSGFSLPPNKLLHLRTRGYYPTGRRTGSGSLTESVHQVYLPDEKCSFYVIKAANGKGISICL